MPFEFRETLQKDMELTSTYDTAIGVVGPGGVH
jgi:hypothetical protein